MSATESPTRPAGLLYSTPILGALARDIGRDINMVFYLFLILATVMVFAIKAFGIAALVVTYVALVPVIFALLIWITLP